MPDFLPTVSPSTGMAEQMMRMRAERPNPWVALAQSLSNSVTPYLQHYGQEKMRQSMAPTVSPEEQVRMGVTAPGAGGKPPEAMFKRNVPMSLAENILQRRTQEEQTRVRAGLTSLPVTEMHREQYKKVYGHAIPFSEITQQQEKELSTQFAAKSKPPAGTVSGSASKELAALGKDIDPSDKRSGAFAVSKQVFDRAERLQSLASAFKGGDFDSRNTEELAIGLNAMLSGSNTGAQEQVKALVPKTALGNYQKLKEWLVNEPQGLDQQAFIDRMLGSVEREKSTAAEQIKRTQMQRLAAHASVEKKDPKAFAEVIQSYGITPDEYHQWKRDGFKKKSAVQSADGGSKTENNPLGLGL